MSRDSLGSIVLIMICISAMVITPTILSAQQKDQITQEYVSTKTVKFVDNIRAQGKLTSAMYDSFIKELDSSDNLYNIEIEYARRVISPSNNDSYTTTMESYYQDEIMAALYTGSELGSTIDGQSDGILYCNQGDYISITVTSKNETIASTLITIFNGVRPVEPSINVTYGGEIRDTGEREVTWD